jgi:hypothetical protein
VILNLSPEELAAWRGHNVSKLALAWLADRIETFRRDIPLFIVANRIDDARAASGALKGYQEVLNAFLEEPPPVEETVEEKFIDPASRPSTRETT